MERWCIDRYASVEVDRARAESPRRDLHNEKLCVRWQKAYRDTYTDRVKPCVHAHQRCNRYWLFTSASESAIPHMNYLANFCRL